MSDISFIISLHVAKEGRVAAKDRCIKRNFPKDKDSKAVCLVKAKWLGLSKFSLVVVPK